ncbi:MAG: GNAT family N-acetyltransferase [Desulfobaccales bacterium]
MMILIGNNLILRPLERKDLDRSRAWVNDMEIGTALLRILPVTEIEQEKWFEEICKQSNKMVWAIDYNNNHIGNVGLYKIDFLHRRAEAWGYIGDKSLRGRGLGKEAFSLLLHYGFNSLDLNKIYLHVGRENQVAIAMYQSLGFVKEGDLAQEYFIRGSFRDVIRMRLLISEWPTGKEEGLATC